MRMKDAETIDLLFWVVSSLREREREREEGAQGAQGAKGPKKVRGSSHTSELGAWDDTLRAYTTTTEVV